MSTVTGRLHCRVHGASRRPGCEETHVLVAVIGILSVPKDAIEHNQLLAVAGDASAEAPGVLARLRTEADGSFDAAGMSAGSILMKPIWKV